MFINLLIFALNQIIAVSVASEVKQLIIDTDIGFDVDDAGALAVANHLQDQGLCQLLGVVHNTAFYKGIGAVDVINNHYHRRDLQLGGYRDQWGSSDDAQDAQDSYTTTIESDFPSSVQNYDQVPDEVAAYRTMLQEAENNSVIIASIGELTNLRNILEVEPDLFAQKVKEIYYMDGGYNFGCGDSEGSEWSPYLGSTEDCDGAAQYVIEHVPKSIKQVFSLEGEDVLTGGRFNEGCGAGPVKEAYQIYTNYGSRPSWDLIAVYVAVLGTDSLSSKAVPFTDTVDYYGFEDFDYDDTSNNQFQLQIDENSYGDVTRILDDMICAFPCRSVLSIGGCAKYELNAGRNCYGDRGDGVWHGADDLEDPVDSSAGTMTLAECQRLCDATAGCDGVTVSSADETGLVNCYRKANIDINECDFDFYYETHTRRSE